MYMYIYIIYLFEAMSYIASCTHWPFF